LARKNVELSSVRLMIAEGGNSDAGLVMEKKDRMSLFGDLGRAKGSPCSRYEWRKEEKVNSTVANVKQANRRTIRGERILATLGASLSTQLEQMYDDRSSECNRADTTEFWGNKNVWVRAGVLKSADDLTRDVEESCSHVIGAYR
jgi:hypothetical protein